MYALNNQNNWTDICINKNKDNELSESVYIYIAESSEVSIYSL